MKILALCLSLFLGGCVQVYTSPSIPHHVHNGGGAYTQDGLGAYSPDVRVTGTAPPRDECKVLRTAEEVSNCFQRRLANRLSGGGDGSNLPAGTFTVGAPLPLPLGCADTTVQDEYGGVSTMRVCAGAAAHPQ